ncbi:MAPEG family protein [uncultured Paraglaciecola sp.]|uniref:MAPEG family protein n=1 Tax=uncultured Paraglaciecola sp. TaxID=1765024 RepID=UPI0030D7608F|tara:strand:- start:28702 stop:29088 length:387 start_codon:yes stop_codon:yes gene_type:complete
MTIIIICLFIATAMPIIAKAPLAIAMNKAGGYDNRNPREQQKSLTGFGARAKAAHENCFEALIMFTPGALLVLITNNTGQLAEYFAIGFVVSRIVYLFAYYADKHLLRSCSWGIGFISSLALICLAIP